jgi:hypothetical protein
MVRAILDGSKTQTRRVMRPQPEQWETAWHAPGQPNGELAKLWGWQAPDGGPFIEEAHYDWPAAVHTYCPYGQPGDRLLVPDADGLQLEIVGLRVERLQDISEDDALCEGADMPLAGRGLAETRRRVREIAFPALWESIYGAGSWDANPWVWVVEFKRVTP